MTRHTAGFSLVEVLVALAVASLAMGSFANVLSQGWSSVRASSRHLEALALAQEQLAAAGVVTPLAEGRFQGRADDGLKWETETRAVAEAGDLAHRTVRAYWVTATVSWPASSLAGVRSLALSTLKLSGEARR